MGYGPEYDQWYKEKVYQTPVRRLRIMKERKVPGKDPRQRVVV
jgi:hypothetical protein